LLIGPFKVEIIGEVAVKLVEFPGEISRGTDDPGTLEVVVIVYEDEGDDQEDQEQENELVPGNERQQVAHLT
jgi:hypothetical protein